MRAQDHSRRPHEYATHVQLAIFIDAGLLLEVRVTTGRGSASTTLVVNSELGVCLSMGLRWLDAPTENSKSIMNEHDRKLKIDHEQTRGLANTNS
jgi:hypothetical protein